MVKGDYHNPRSATMAAPGFVTKTPPEIKTSFFPIPFVHLRNFSDAIARTGG
jgi:hypothetical protein